MSKVILPTLTGYASVVDCVDGTVMIAAETTSTAAIIFPFWYFVEDNVIYRTLFGTATTVYADITIYSEFLVSNHEAVEVGSYDMTERPGCQAQRQLTVAHLPLCDHLDESVKILSCLRQLPLLTFRCIGIHKGQTDVALRHCERLAAMEHNSLI